MAGYPRPLSNYSRALWPDNSPSVMDPEDVQTRRSIGQLLENIAPYLLGGVAGRGVLGRLAGMVGQAPKSSAVMANTGLAALLQDPSMLGGPATGAMLYSPESEAVIKPKGGNWLPGSVEKVLGGLKRNPVPEATTLEAQAIWGRVNPAQAQINKWIEGPLTKYVKTRMASPDDEVRKLAEKGVLHTRGEELYPRYGNLEAHEPRKLMGSSDLAKYWENASDSQIIKAPSKEFPGQIDYQMARTSPPADLGFPHLIDELSNALNPTSGLPRHLQLTPEAVQNLSMEKAVRRVADINKWRADQKVEANRALAEKASVVREYAENNPKGLRWVELKQQEGLPPGYKLQPTKTGLIDVVGPGGRWAAVNEKEAIGKAWGAARANGYNPLGDQLKYEGDTMGHCVGGYCDDVLSGRSRIYSLRDAKGEPHVTVEVEVTPGRRTFYGHDRARDLLDDVLGMADPEEIKNFEELSEKNLGVKMSIDDWLERHLSGMGKYIDPRRSRELGMDLLSEVSPKVHARMLNEVESPAELSIVQIKGKQNKAPNEEYLPFVQDFVRNSPLGSSWSDVGDLGNTGLFNPLNALTREELRSFGDNIPKFMSMDEIKKLREGKPWVPIDNDPELDILPAAVGGGLGIGNYYYDED